MFDLTPMYSHKNEKSGLHSSISNKLIKTLINIIFFNF